MTHRQPTVSVIIPSRLAPAAGSGERLFLEDAVHSIGQQATIGREHIQIVVGVDVGTVAPAGLAQRLRIELVESGGRSQAAALNAAAERAEGEFLAILEDDDIWDPKFLRTALDALGKAEFASSTAPPSRSRPRPPKTSGPSAKTSTAAA